MTAAPPEAASSNPNWVTKKALLLLHEESLAEFGGARGVRDEGLLDSALARPRNTLSYQSYQPQSALPDLAASLGFGLARNHPFVDGHKRVSFLAIGLFLSINGLQLQADAVDAIRTILSLASGELDESALTSWIARNVARK